MPSTPVGPSEDPSMNVLIIYDSLPLLMRAKALIKNAIEKTGLKIRLKTRSWRLGPLELFSPNQGITSDAPEAHLIVFGCEDVNSFLPEIENWLEQWALQRKTKDVALAVISENQRTLSFISRRVSQFAEQQGLDFLPVNYQMTGRSESPGLQAAAAN